MKISRKRPESVPGPAEHFIGDVWLDAIVGDGPPDGTPPLVHFAPGARTAWHRHPLGQVLYVIEGEGLATETGGPVGGGPP